MSDRAEMLMLTGIVLPCPDCCGERLFVAPDPLEAAAYGADLACTNCGAAIFLDACSASPDPLSVPEVFVAGAA